MNIWPLKPTSILIDYVNPLVWSWLLASVYLVLAGLFLAIGWQDPTVNADPSTMGHVAARRRGGFVLLIIQFWPYVLMAIGGISAWKSIVVLQMLSPTTSSSDSGVRSSSDSGVSIKQLFSNGSLKKRIHDALANAGVSNLSELGSWTDEELLDLPGIGPAAVSDIRALMKDHGL